MSVSDLMTGLMVIFLFVAIAYIRIVQEQHKTLDENVQIIKDFVDARLKMHDKLVNAFASDTARWNMVIGRDLSIRFTKTDVFFESGKAEISAGFKDILDDFLPRYFDVLLRDSLRDKISEVRIEGHTDPEWKDSTKDAFLENVRLSQERALSVLKHYRQMQDFIDRPSDEKVRLEYWFTANGLSSGHTLDADGALTFVSKHPADYEKSRRVEIRIITSSDSLIEKLVKEAQ